MDIPTLRLDFDLEPGASGRMRSERVRLPMLRQGADYSEEIGLRSDQGVDHDFTVYDEIILTARVTVQSADVVMTLKKSTGELLAGPASLIIAIPAEKTAPIPLPAGLRRIAGPQIARFGYDIRLIRDGRSHALAEGTLCMIYAFTRARPAGE